MDNLWLYESVRTVPTSAQKSISGGRLSGKTDINPMWRIKVLTEKFGLCGIGWKYEITRQWTELGANDEMSAFCNINLYIKRNETWSDAIPGTGGSAFITKEKGGLYTSDECFKMALTDAISVSCKALGVGADVYWDKDTTKYSPNKTQGVIADEDYFCVSCDKRFEPCEIGGKKLTAKDAYINAERRRGKPLCKECFEKENANA